MRIFGMFSLAASLLLAPGDAATAEGDVEYLGDLIETGSVRHRQQWGELGLNAAARRSGAREGSPLRIGKKTYERGIGHHANGEIVVSLGGKYEEFMATVGVQWQGGNRGSVVFRVLVDGRRALESGPLSDTDPPRSVRISLRDARELRFSSGDGGDGIACDMANWARARLLRDPRKPRFGRIEISLNGVSVQSGKQRPAYQKLFFCLPRCPARPAEAGDEMYGKGDTTVSHRPRD